MRCSIDYSNVGYAEFHRIDLGNDLERQMFEMSMSVNRSLYGVIDILVEMNWLDKEFYQKEKVLWSDKFMDSIRAVYINRKRPVPTKDNFYRDSTGRNKSIVEYSIEEDSTEEKREKKQDSLLSVIEYEELFPHKNVSKSLEKYLEYDKSPIHTKALKWLENEKELKPLEFKKSADGKNIAYCKKCGNQEFPDVFQLKQGSSCCHVEYTNVRPNEARVSKESDAPF